MEDEVNSVKYEKGVALHFSLTEDKWVPYVKISITEHEMQVCEL